MKKVPAKCVFKYTYGMLRFAYRESYYNDAFDFLMYSSFLDDIKTQLRVWEYKGAVNPDVIDRVSDFFRLYV